MPTLVVDTREKKPYEFPGIDSVVRKPLDVGDYTHEGYESVYAVERKTIEDLANSLASERARFKNEILRANGMANRNENNNPLPGTAPDHDGLKEFAVVIESTPEEVREFSKNLDRAGMAMPEARTAAKRGQIYWNLPYWYGAHPNSVLGTVNKWPSRYSSLDFVWAGDREGGKQETLRLLDKWFLNYGSM